MTYIKRFAKNEIKHSNQIEFRIEKVRKEKGNK